MTPIYAIQKSKVTFELMDTVRTQLADVPIRFVETPEHGIVKMFCDLYKAREIQGFIQGYLCK